ncbi:dicer-2 protein [Chlamydoabsidia padenii]|nr:dicer-2 protein [Chlamydoabsidia padenii]
MTKKGLNLTQDDLDTAESFNVAPEQIENTMNSGRDFDYLSRYIDAEFLEASPDALAKSIEQLEMERKEKVDEDETPEMTDEEKQARQLSPREYQNELYQKALKENVIAVLHTGSGKTLIAVMLIKQMALQEKLDRLVRHKTKLTFFLVDRVPLVFQQAGVIRANCDVEVQHMCGQMDVDHWSEKKWKTLFEEVDVCVMTAQIFLDILRHGFVRMDNVNLLIFDECHHAIKRHPYNVVMREFYDTCPELERPRIFGMTASPLNSKAKVQYSATQLEQNLCSLIYTATNQELLTAVLKPPIELTIPFKHHPLLIDTPLTATIRQKIGHIERYHLCFKRVTQVLNDLGPWCSDRLWEYMLMELDRKLKGGYQGMDTEYLLAEDRALQECTELVETNKLIEYPEINTEWFTPKMIRLFQIMKTYTVMARDDRFCGIIFVETRHTAKAIQLALEANRDLHGCYKCDILIGHGGREEGDMNMGFREQNRIIEKFRRGDLNLLIATNVAEEGLDIQPCNVVIRFDFMTTPIGYIQSRGRARRENSKFIIMMEKDNNNQQGQLQQFRDSEVAMKAFCQELPAERNVALKFATDPGDRPYDPEEDDDEMYMEDAYVVESTQATVTRQSAVPLLHRYCGSLPSDRFTALQPAFEIAQTLNEGFTCTVRLPSNAAVREITSKVCRTKIQAKKVAAVECCKALHLKKALTDHLLPINYKRELLGNMEPVLDENGMVVGSRRRKAMYEKRIPSFWKRPVPYTLDGDEEEDGDEGAGDNENKETDVDLLKARKAPTKNIANGDQDDTHQISTISTNGDGITSNDDSSNNLIDFEVETTNNDINANTLQNQVEHDTSMVTVQEKAKVERMEIDEIPLEDTDGPFDLHVSLIEFNVDGGAIDGIKLRRLCMMTWKPFPELPEMELNIRGSPFIVQVRPFDLPISVDKEAIMVLKDFNITMASAITNKEFSCLLGDFPYFLAPLVLGSKYDTTPTSIYDQFDWPAIHQAVGKTLSPLEFDKNNDNDFDDVIIVDYANRSQRYFINRVCHELTPSSPIVTSDAVRELGYDSMADYYQKALLVEVTNWEQPILNVRKISKVMNYLSPSTVVEPIIRKSTAAYVIPEFCQRYYISASVFQSWMVIPSVMTRLDAFLSSHDARKRYDLLIEDNLMLEAYTTPSANMKMDYERLETLGDSFLKFVATCRLYTNYPANDEGELHCQRIRVICNRALYRAAKRLKIYRYVTSHTFNRRHWRPHGFIATTDTEDTLKDARQHTLSDKTLADIVEASLGAAFLSGGLEAGLRCAIAMQIPFDDIETWSDFYPTYLSTRSTLPPRAEVTALRSVNMMRVQQICNYEFSNGLLVVEALTHASLPNSTAPCYQRLEFLGDAILDFLVIQYLYNKYPDADPGTITDLKDSCVNNHVLGIVCIENGLHKQIIHFSSILIRSIEETVKEIKTIKENKQDIGEYWLSLNIPKVLSDVVESMLGAVFVDGQFHWEPVQRLFEHWLVPLLDVHVTPELVQVHPVNRLVTKLQRLGCEAFMLRNVTTSSTGATGQKCVIFLHEKAFASGASDNIKVARRQAAERALDRIAEEPGLLEAVCNCGVIREQKVAKLLIEEDHKEDDVGF